MRYDVSRRITPSGDAAGVGAGDASIVRTFAVAALAVAVLAGPGALSARRPPNEPPAGQLDRGKAPKPEPVKGPPGKGSSQPQWLRQTDRICRNGLRERKVVLARARKAPAGSTRRTLVRILQGFVRIEGTMLAELEGVDPPQRSRAELADALGRFRARRAEDVALLVQLRRRWDTGLLDRQLRRDRATNVRLGRLWTKLGSVGCATYFRAAQGR